MFLRMMLLTLTDLCFARKRISDASQPMKKQFVSIRRKAAEYSLHGKLGILIVIKFEDKMTI